MEFKATTVSSQNRSAVVSGRRQWWRLRGNRSQFIEDGKAWYAQGESNPCLRRERAVKRLDKLPPT